MICRYEQRYESEKEKLQKVFKTKETESVIDNLKQQAEIINNQLANARKESFNDEQNLFVRKYQRRINETKNKINLLLKQKTQLEKEIEMNKQKREEIQTTMKIEKEHHDHERIHTTEKIVSLNKLLDEFVEKCQQMNKNVQDELPILEGLNNKVEKIEKIETETKSLQVEMNQNIRSLENEINRLNNENKKLDFDLGITKQEQTIQHICSDWEKILRFKSILRNQYQSIKGSIDLRFGMCIDSMNYKMLFTTNEKFSLYFIHLLR
ncbi:uncharacterized protein DC041_0006249 [Schistosoma bovis]|uniref:Uncharacterized protein n=1 Tax=Schistosoma bovis TaxID=6184 RepID=A0A430QAM8_SCHBO|nr:uncharacterized protein DC041_0006249 [Schistosoma bovis]